MLSVRTVVSELEVEKRYGISFWVPTQFFVYRTPVLRVFGKLANSKFSKVGVVVHWFRKYRDVLLKLARSIKLSSDIACSATLRLEMDPTQGWFHQHC